MSETLVEQGGQKMTLDQALETATRHLRNGQLGEAESLYRQILSYVPQHSQALHFLGIIEAHKGNLETGIDLIRQAIALEPKAAMFHCNLGEILRRSGRLQEAIVSFKRAAEFKPDAPENLQNLADALRKAGRVDEAIRSYRRLIELKLADANALNKLGVQHAIEGRFDDAIGSFRRATELNSGVVEAFNNLGRTLTESGRAEEGLKLAQKAGELNSGFAKTQANLGVGNSLIGNHEEAIKAYARALEIQPELGDVHGHLANSLRETGKMEESITHYRKAVELQPDSPAVHSALIFTLQTSSGDDRKEVAEELRRYAGRYEARLTPGWPDHENDPDPDRKLRIGYLSADFRVHPLSNCMVPLLSNHDRAKVEVFCYANVSRTDDLTARLRGLSDHWREAWGRTDEELFEEIRADRIDILVDLSMHSGDNRLLVMARKPAPVQATFLAYPGETGLSAIDYRLTDLYLDPSDLPKPGSAERPIRLGHSYWCYDPLIESVEVGELPAQSRGYVTFVSLNKFSKASPGALDLWAQILGRVEGSHLLLNAFPGSSRQRVLDQFGPKGVDPARVEFVGRQSLLDYIRSYRRADIGLDPFPFCGGLTTCDALWMGVPVVTLAGEPPISRGGCSIMSNAGLKELIASSASEYVEIAVNVAGDMDRLADMRAKMRGRLEGSSLMNGRQYAADVEAAFREMWREWCAGKLRNAT